MLEKTELDLSLTGFVQKAQRKHASSTHQDFCSHSLDFTMSASLLTGTGKTELLLELHFCSWKGSTCETSTAVFISSITGEPPEWYRGHPHPTTFSQSASSYRGRPPILTQQRIPKTAWFMTLFLGRCYLDISPNMVTWLPCAPSAPGSGSQQHHSRPQVVSPLLLTPSSWCACLGSNSPFYKDISHTDLGSTQRPHSSLDNLRKDPTEVL